MDIDPEKIYLRPQQFYESVNINILTNKCAKKVSLKEKLISFTDESDLKYDKLVIATG